MDMEINFPNLGIYLGTMWEKTSVFSDFPSPITAS